MAGAPERDDLVVLPGRLLEAVRLDEPTEALVGRLSAVDPDALAAALDTDAKRYAFWLNTYNAWVQRALAQDLSRLDRRWRFFRAKRVPVAGRALSLDDIEHGLLRRSRLKLGLGYLPNPFAGPFERRFRVDERDQRIHFALNCGAVSCPPIAAYDPARIDAQLETAAVGYLEETVEYAPEPGVVEVPRLFSWYRGDFGGKSGTVAFLRGYGLVPDDATPSVSYRPYDWSPELGDYR